MTAPRTQPVRARGSAAPAAAPAGAPRFEPRPRPGSAGAAPRFEPRPRPEPAPRRAAAPAAPRHLRLVDPAELRHRRVTRALTAVLVAAVCAGLFGIVIMRVALAQGQVQVDHLQTSVATQTAAQQQLQLQVAQLEAPAQIVAAARSRLGMVTPSTVTALNPPPATTP